MLSPKPLRILLLPNNGHPYGDSLQQGLRHAGVETLVLDAGWGFDLRKHVDRVIQLKPDILHLQWPESLFQLGEGEEPDEVAGQIRQALVRFRDAGIPMVWTLHNLRPHASGHTAFYTAVYAHYAAHASGIIHHSHCGMALARKTYDFAEDAIHAVRRHGYFAADSISSLSRQEARRRLGLDDKAALYFFCGSFRRDKHIDVLIKAMASNRVPAAQYLILVGQEKEVAAGLYPELYLDYPNLMWPGRVSFEELGIYAKAVDALITAHGVHHLTSAGPHLSQTYLKPQVCLRSPYNEEVLGESAIYFDGAGDRVANLKDCLAHINRERLAHIPSELEVSRREYEWDRIAVKTKALYEEVLHE